MHSSTPAAANVMKDPQPPPDKAGAWITKLTLAAFIVVWWFSNAIDPNYVLIAAIIVLLAYRFAKETRTSWRQ